MQEQSQHSPLVVISGHRAITTSKAIADCFGKQHRDVLRAIENLLLELDADHQRNFAQTVIERENPSGGAPIKSPVYEMTRDGFTLLAMGFTGKKALTFKLAYIDAFNRMEAELKAIAPQTVEHILNTTIGTDGFHVLGALVSGKVKKLRGSQRRAMAGEIWAQVRKAFGVSRGEDIPVEKMDAARNFIAAYAVEGQWIPGNAPASSFRQEFAKNAHDAFPPDVQAAIDTHTWHLTEQAYERIAKYVDGSVHLCAGHGQEVSREAAMQRIKQITLQDALTLSADEMVMVLGMADHIAGCARNYADAVRNGLQALLERGMVIGPMIKPA